MKVGIALGGGGVRGLAHILALQTIDDLGIKPSAVAGTSMGSIIGALYASGRSGREIHELLDGFIIKKGEGIRDIYRKKASLIKWLKAFRPVMGKAGMIEADGLMQYLLDDIRVEKIEELKIPFKAVATDYYRREPVVFSEGSLLTAIRASMSIPGVFVPVEHEGRVLVDGGLTNQVPYDLLTDDCDVTIAIDVGPTWDSEETQPPSALDATLGMFDLVVDKVVEARMKECAPTIYFRPRLHGIRVLDFDKIEDVFDQAQPAMDDLKRQLEGLSGP